MNSTKCYSVSFPFSERKLFRLNPPMCHHTALPPALLCPAVLCPLHCSGFTGDSSNRVELQVRHQQRIIHARGKSEGTSFTGSVLKVGSYDGEIHLYHGETGGD